MLSASFRLLFYTLENMLVFKFTKIMNVYGRKGGYDRNKTLSNWTDDRILSVNLNSKPSGYV
jgi:hypothetical protein